MNTEATKILDVLSQAVETADLVSIEGLPLNSIGVAVDLVVSTPEIAQAERQAKARLGFFDRAMRSNGTAPPTGDIEKLRRRAGRALGALRDLIETASASAPA